MTTAILAVSFVLDYLARLWAPVSRLRPLSLFRYYEPQAILASGLSRVALLTLGGTLLVGATGRVAGVVPARPLTGALSTKPAERHPRIGVPAIACLEVAALAQRGRITLDRPVLDWMQAALALPRVELLALFPAVAVNAMALSESFPGDPADRLIVATTIIERGTLVTRDDRIRRSALVPTVWA